MPFIELPNEDVTMHYRSNLSMPLLRRSASLPVLDSRRQTIILLPGTILDVQDMDELFRDKRLSSKYNLIAFDPRSVGQTKNPVSYCRDANVAAADIVKAMDVLGVKRAHVYGVSGGGVAAAKRMAVFWPEKVLSLTLVAIQAEKTYVLLHSDDAGIDDGCGRPEWVNEGYAEVINSFVNAPDLDTLEECINEMYPIAFGNVRPFCFRLLSSIF